MADDVRERRANANLRNYADGVNLRRRQALLACAMPPAEPQPHLWDLFDWPADAVVLDLGSGTGMWTALAAQHTLDGAVIALDRSMGMAATTLAAGLTTVQADAHDLPFADEAFDVVLATWSLYHLPDKQRALTEVCRVLRPGGRLVAATNEATSVPLVDDLMAAAVGEVVGHTVARWIEPLDFTLENGADVLAPWFGSVDVHVNTTPYQVTDAEVLHGYALSLEDPVTAEVGLTREQYAQVVATFDRRVGERLAAEPIRFTRRTAFFDARGPR